MKNKLIRAVVIFMALSLLGFLFGGADNSSNSTEYATGTEPVATSSVRVTSTAPSYPFDTQKAYHYRRSGMIAGSSCKVSVEPADVVQVYEYVDYPAPEQCGMQDNGADIYFEGLKVGEAKVTLLYTYPTMEPEEVTFTLKVSEDFTVTKVE